MAEEKEGTSASARKSKKASKEKLASKDDFLRLASDEVLEKHIEVFHLNDLDLDVKIAPARFRDFHRILTEIRESGGTAEEQAELELAWIVACMVEPEITADDAARLMESRSPDIGALAVRCASISGMGYNAEMVARQAVSASDDETPEGDSNSPLG